MFSLSFDLLSSPSHNSFAFKQFNTSLDDLSYEIPENKFEELSIDNFFKKEC